MARKERALQDIDLLGVFYDFIPWILHHIDFMTSYNVLWNWKSHSPSGDV